MSRWIILLFGLIINFAVVANEPASKLKATVDRTKISRGETLNLNLRYEGQSSGQPDFTPLQQDFEILSNNRQSQITVLNGRTESYTSWQLVLLPKLNGTVFIPNLSFNGHNSLPIEIVVSEDTLPREENQAVFTETIIDQQTAYVQQQILLSLRLYTAVPLENFSSDELKVDGAQLIKLDSHQYKKQIHDRSYTVVDSQYAIFPEKHGELIIPSIRFGATIVDPANSSRNSFFRSRGKQIILQSQEKKIQILAKNDFASGPHWLPANKIVLEQNWSAPVDTFTVGEPITRTLILTAEGLTAAQLPPLPIPAADGFRSYPDQAQLEDNTTDQGVTGQRIESFALVPKKPGKLILPPIELDWWNTKTDQAEKIVLPSQTVTVLPAVDVASQPPVAETSVTALPAAANGMKQSPSPDQTRLVYSLIASNLILFIMCAALATAWWRAKKPPTDNSATSPDSVNPAFAFRNIKAAAKRQDLPQLRTAILEWGRTHWQKPSIQSLQQIAQLARSNNLADHFNQLDSYLYSNGHQNNFDLADLLSELDKANKSKPDQSNSNQDILQPLYPDSTAG